jgi:hemoglobin/transferrin/lactoferrin receptor protein
MLILIIIWVELLKKVQAPLDHIAPFFGKIGIMYANLGHRRHLLYNGKKKRSDYSSSGEDNLQYAPVNGMPAWETYNVKTMKCIIMLPYLQVSKIRIHRNSSGINASEEIYMGISITFKRDKKSLFALANRNFIFMKISI